MQALSLPRTIMAAPRASMARGGAGGCVAGVLVCQPCRVPALRFRCFVFRWVVVRFRFVWFSVIYDFMVVLVSVVLIFVGLPSLRFLPCLVSPCLAQLCLRFALYGGLRFAFL